VDFSLSFWRSAFCWVITLLYQCGCDSNATGLLDMYALCRINWRLGERYAAATGRKHQLASGKRGSFCSIPAVVSRLIEGPKL